MSFLYPGFLWALSALAIPVIIHLFYFRRYQKVYFSNVRFLSEVREETATRNRLKHRLILLSRLLALAALVLAFAQPYLPGEESGVQQVSRQVSVFVDNSFSMDALGEDRSLFEQAKDRARQIVGGYGPDDRFQLLSGELSGSQQRLLDRDAFLAELDKIELSARSPGLDQVHERQRDALSRAPENAGVAWILSDFQKSIADFEPDTALQINLLPLPGARQQNIGIDSVWFEEPVLVRGQRTSLLVRVKNFGDRDAEKTTLRLFLGTEVKALGQVDIPAGQAITDTLSFGIPESEWVSGHVQINDYPINFDDTWYFSFPVLSEVPVLVLGGAQGNPFLRTLFGSRTLFRLDEQRVDNLDYASLNSYRLVVLDGLNSLSSGLAASLSEYLLEGGSVLVFPGPEADRNSYNQWLSRAGATLGERTLQLREVGSLNTQNPLFRDVFARVPENLALPSAQLSYRLPASAMSRQDNLMRFKDGDAFLGRYPLGKGWIYLCASPLSREASDLPVQGALFAPLLFRMALSGAADRALAHTIGRDEWIDAGSVQESSFSNPDQQLRVRFEEQMEFLPRTERRGNRLRLQVGAQATQAGHYQVLMPDASLGAVFSMNFDRRESRMDFLSNSEVEEHYPAGSVRVMSADAPRLAADLSRISQGRQLWKACLILALAFLGIEILLVRFL